MRKLHSAIALVASSVLGGCVVDDAPAPDLLVRYDFARPGADLTGEEMPDLAASGTLDLAGPRPDLVGRDLAVPRDLAAPRDLAVPVDLARPPDLSRPPDLAMPCRPVVNEVMTGSSLSALDEFIEIYNPCGVALDVGGYQLVYRSANNNGGGADTNLGFFPQGRKIGPRDFLVVCGADHLFGCDLYALSAIASAGGAVGLRDGGGRLLDSVAWKTLAVANALTERAPADAPPVSDPPGDSIGRFPDGTDTNDNAADFSLSIVPTPGSANF